MTVCVAVLCTLNYAEPGDPPDIRLVAMTASDRMITSGDVQYEPNQTKVAEMTRHTLLLIAGDYSLHTEAIRSTKIELLNRPEASPNDIALIYGRTIQAIKRRQAEDTYLAPLGLNNDLLMAQQKEMSDYIVEKLVAQMQNYRGEDVEALVVGVDDKRDGNGAIYHVDNFGSVSCADDIGFAAIGSGAWHARSQLMVTGYTPHINYFRALPMVHAAKKAADISPGVGNYTDINLIFRSGFERLMPETYDKLEELYRDVTEKRAQITSEASKALYDFVVERAKAKADKTPEKQFGKEAQDNAGVSSNAPESARSDDGLEGKAVA